jgi:uncharacterized membrane protein
MFITGGIVVSQFVDLAVVTYSPLSLSRDSLVGIVTGYGLDGVRVLVGGKICLLYTSRGYNVVGVETSYGLGHLGFDVRVPIRSKKFSPRL